ncbi:unnamed protein product [Durusdinium trenchii]|uniref:Uncharacterized protein n=1 Tax=Durusdinium trenchii TaxID=1381693 RepID=A0ABP0SEZ3_9DINO
MRCSFLAILALQVASRTFEERSVRDLHEHGLLPESDVAGLRLRSVYIAHRSSELVEAKGSEGRGGPEEEAQAAPKRKPWRLSRTHVPDHFDSRDFDEDSLENTHRGRLLTGYPKSELLETALGIGFAFRTPRDKVLSVAALLAASTPLAAYNVTYHYEKWRPTYNNGTSPYVNWCENSTVDCLTLENATMGEALAEIEASIFTASREEIKTAAGDHYVQDHFLGLRESTCENTESTGERCFGDEGVAMSFYEDDDSKILVFQAGLGESDRNNLLWQNKAWIIESFEAAMKEQWVLNAQQASSSEISARKAADAYEFPLRCGFLDEAYSPIIDKSGLTLAVESVAQTTLEDEGLWPLIKLIVRERLTEGVTEAKTVYLAGTGLGGSHAALVSMWLKKNEDKSYDTYLIAAPGFQCIARDKYSKDLTPSDTHSQLMIYTHVMDALAGSVDQYSGTVCHYGLRNFTSSESFYDYCSRMIGHTGPEIFWRSTTVTTTTAEDATEEDLELIAEYAQNISSAQEAFDQCHRFTHSVWYALILLSSEDVLNLDGTTDGGCETVDPIDADDKYTVCPNTDQATTDCENFFAPSAEVSMEMLAIIVGSTGGVIAFCAVVGILVVRHVQKNAMEDVVSSNDQGPPSTGCFARLMRNCGVYLGAKGVDRAKDARLRAKRARDKRRNRNFQEKTTLLVEGVVDSGAASSAGALPTTVGREAEDALEAGMEEGGAEHSKKKEKKDKKDKKEKKEKKAKKGEVEATQETEIVDAVSVRVVKDDEVHGTEHVRPEDVTIGTDDLLGGRVVEKEKKGRKRDSRDTE